LLLFSAELLTLRLSAVAPEVIELKGATYASDIWSLGCTVVELLTGRPPWADDTNTLSVMFHIVEDGNPPIPDGCSVELDDFLRLCFQKNAALRPKAEELFEHPWLRKSREPHGVNELNHICCAETDNCQQKLRPNDGIPLLRGVGVDAALDAPRTPFKEGALSRFTWRPSGTPPELDVITPRAHNFIKTSFAKSKSFLFRSSRILH